MIGMHLIIDGVLVRHLEKEDMGLILSELPAEIGMKILEGPYIVEGHQENPGLTGFVIIDTPTYPSTHSTKVARLLSISSHADLLMKTPSSDI